MEAIWLGTQGNVPMKDWRRDDEIGLRSTCQLSCSLRPPELRAEVTQALPYKVASLRMVTANDRYIPRQPPRMSPLTDALFLLLLLLSLPALRFISPNRLHHFGLRFCLSSSSWSIGSCHFASPLRIMSFWPRSSLSKHQFPPSVP